MIRGVSIVPVKCNVDDRGFLYQIYQITDNVFPDLKRIYVVGNFGQGTVRGFHKHLEESKCFFVANGTVKFVLVDDTQPKPEINTIVLSSKNPTILVVSPNIYHGWVSLEENTLLIGMSNKTLDESLKDDFRIDPYTYGDIWAVKDR
jgi:dTDP-4-dehydrorhamnose 3,5-epimerase-like enzyme